MAPAQQPITTSGGNRLAGIEGLRALAAGSILAYHVWLFDGGGRVGAGGPAEAGFENLAHGVTLFFALSGFLLYRPFAAAIARAQPLPSVRAYLRNRALRIMPAYWAILLVTALVLGTAAVRDESGALGHGALTDPVLLGQSALLLQGYDPATVAIGIAPAWSLAVEAVFYVLLALLVAVVAAAARGRPVRSRRVLVLLLPALLLLLVGLSGKYVAGVVLDGSPGDGWSSNWYSVVERSFWANADLFSFGMVAAVVHTEVVDGRLVLPRGWRPAALGVAAAIFAASAATLDGGQLTYLPQNTAVALAAALLVAAACFPTVAGARAPRLRRLLEGRALVVVGIGSYSVFLWHVPVIHWLADHGTMRGGWAGLGLNLALTALVVGALSAVTY
ncbi:MAG TPA: acyltransferase, partial [Solirubrobacteraceae bacterium]|nr:acyltransferase [Solirubrobacteraceae bacterium]